MRYLELADLHYSPARKEDFKNVFQNILNAADDVDFCVFPGDLFDRTVYADEDLNTLLDLMAELLSKVPCCGTCGTPGHENRSMYKSLENIGFVLLEPAVEYGFFKDFGIKKTNGELVPQVLIYGLDEVTKKNYIARHPEEKNTSELNYKICNILENIIKNDIGAKRSRCPEVPSVLVVHGNISDAVDRVAEKNEALKRSEIIIKTEWIKEANITRTSAGHIHQAIEFEKINGGYGGSPAWDWNSTGFKPSMNLVELDGSGAIVSRIPYGTPERRKIYKPLDKYESYIAYWLEYDGDLNLNPAEHGAHPWSRMTLPEKEKTTRRVDIADVENKPLAEIAEIFDKNITKQQKAFLTEAEKIKTAGAENARVVQVLSVEVTGCKLFKNHELKINLADITGLTQIVGENGSGKSSVLAFCTPYPCVVGKDTASGRVSAIKDFFTDETGSICKKVSLNGTLAEHKILLNKGKCECFLTVGGKPVLEKSNFDTMFEKCVEMYGSYEDYILTSFYVQPLQGKTDSGLMTSGNTELRDIVQKIAGINREEEKRYCLDKVNEYEKKIERVTVQIETLETDSEKLADLEISLKIKNNSLGEVQKEADALEKRAEDLKKVYHERKALADENENKRRKKQELKLEIVKKNNEIKDKKSKIADLPQFRKRLQEAEKQTALYNLYLEENSRYNAAEAEKQKILAEVEKLKADYDYKLKVKETYEHELLVYNKPCPNCGYICEDNKAHIDEINAKIKALNIAEPDLNDLRKKYADFMKVKKPEAVDRPENIELLRADISEAETAEKAILQLETECDALDKQEREIIVIDINTDIEEREAQEAENKCRLKNMELDMLKSECIKLNTQVETIKENLKTARELAETNEADIKILADWKYCADILQANKIPAMELESVLDQIDRTATGNARSYRDQRYIFHTVTQKDGKKSVTDKFDIEILDTVTGAVKSYKEFSVGEKSFLLSAYNKALVEIRKGKSRSEYIPVISDEQDAFIDKDHRAEFYKMLGDEPILLVSHSPDIENFTESKIDIKDLLFS